MTPPSKHFYIVSLPFSAQSAGYNTGRDNEKDSNAKDTVRPRSEQNREKYNVGWRAALYSKDLVVQAFGVDWRLHENTNGLHSALNQNKGG